jgi:hypothetical protein
MATDEQTIEAGDEQELGADLELVSTERLAEVIAGMTEIDATADITRTKYRIVAEMLAAETEEELWKELPTWSSKNSVGESFEITDIRGVFKSRYPDPETGTAGGFLACSAINLGTGEPGIFTTSALRLAGRLGWYHAHGKFPVRIRVVKRGESSGGFDILDGEKLDA